MIDLPAGEIIIGKLPQTDGSGQIQLLRLPDDFDWLRHFETHHIAKFFNELFDALRQSLETGDWAGVTEAIENWKATAEIEASSELQEAIATGVNQLAADDTIGWPQLRQELDL